MEWNGVELESANRFYLEAWFSPRDVLPVLGVLICLARAMAVTQALVMLLFGISCLDPITYLGVIALSLGVYAIAC
jgi:hypothetical protein